MTNKQDNFSTFLALVILLVLFYNPICSFEETEVSNDK